MQIHENFSLKGFNTFGIDVFARKYASFNSTEELNDLLLTFPNITPLVLGGGSNILFTQNVDGIVLKNGVSGIVEVHEDGDFIYVKAGAGENWHEFVQHCIKKNWAGLENLSLIPGNVGASPIQNIGAYGVELANVFHSLEAFDLREKIVRTFTAGECNFGYRDSVFKNQLKNRLAIVSVTVRLRKTPVFHTSYGAISDELEKMGISDLSIQAISQAVINIRQSKLPDPKYIGNAGSFFKNPEVENGQWMDLKQNFPGIVAYPLADGRHKLAAGWLIEQCGWKGFREGDAGVHPRQSLVLVNYGNANGKEIFDLSQRIVESVEGKFGVLLDTEVNII